MRSACFEMLSITNEYARDFIAACERVSTFPLPGDGEVFFYLVTSDAVYQAKCMEDALAEQRDPFSALFNNCHAVMSESGRSNNTGKDRRRNRARSGTSRPWRPQRRQDDMMLSVMAVSAGRVERSRVRS